MIFKKTVAAICYSIARARCEPQATELARRHPDLVRFVMDQQQRMPDYMRLPFRIASVVFDVLGVLHGGRFFHALTHDQRWRQIEAWRTAPIPPCRDFIRFYESLIVYHWYSEPEALGTGGAALRIGPSGRGDRGPERPGVVLP